VSSKLAAILLLLTSLLPAAAQKPNVVIIFVDDLGYGDLGCYGATDIRTPNLDRMAEAGMRFTDFHVAAAVCSASRAALLTGKYPLRTDITGVISANTRRALPLEETTLAERFKELGYATGIFGKWHLGNTPDVWPTRQGFDEWYGTIGSNDMGKGRPSLEQRRIGKAGVELVDQDHVASVNPDQSQLTRRYTEKAVDFIGRNKEKHFFLYVPHNMPHTPLFASERFLGKSKRGLYGDVVEELDWSAGEILKALKQHGIDRNTITLFSSDNGPWLIFGNHGGSAGPFSGGKKQTMEGGMRVPLIIHWPGHIERETTCNHFANAMDLTPTLMTMVGSKSPGAHDGRDITPWILKDRNAAVEERPFFHFWERDIQSVRLGDWKLRLAHTDTQAPNPASIGMDGARGEVMEVKRPQALFNLIMDPGETTDLSAKYPEKVDDLMKHAKAGRTSILQKKD